VCLQAALAAMTGLFDDTPYSMLHLGLNTPVSIDPDTRPPMSLAVVIDVSGSMASAGKIDFVRTGLATLIDALNDDDELALISYSGVATVLSEMAPVGGRRAALHAEAESLVADGWTNLYAGLESGYQQVLAHYDLERQNRVILLSDGMPTAGIIDEDEIFAMSAGYNSEGLGLTTVGLGTEFNPGLMRGLAEQGHGNHYFIEDAASIDEVFSEELSYFVVPVAFDVRLEVQEGTHYVFGQAFGSSFWENTSGGGLVEVPSVFLAHRISDDDTTGGGSGGGRRGGGSALLVRLVPKESAPPPEEDAVVATVDVSFREPGSDVVIDEHVVVTHPSFAGGLPAAGYFDSPTVADTHKTLVMLELYRAIYFACSTFHAGHGTDGLRALARVRAAVVDYNEEIEDVDMQYDLELIDRLRDVMLANGVAPPDSVDIPADPWPAD
jgi:Ca-activated chloride channel family protein